MASQNPDVPIRDAATVILVRDPETNPSVLMGQRGKTAAFMPDKFVFPGGAVDVADADVALPANLSDICQERLTARNSGASSNALATAAIRELWEETGLRLGRDMAWNPAAGWENFGRAGIAPDPSALSFFCRAITPPGRPRRFDARFFLADAAAIWDDVDDFCAAEDELSHLHWAPLTEVRKLNLPFITRVVLAELQAHLPSTSAPDRVPFIRNDAIDSEVIWL